MKLTILQKRMCDIYFSMEKPSKTKAYEMAGYRRRGNSAVKEAHKTHKKPQCQAYLKSLGMRATEKAVKQAEDIIAELEKCGFSNIRDYVEAKKDSISIRDLSELSDDKLAAISEISETSTGIIKIKLYDKLRALKDLGLRFGIFPTKIEHTGELTLAQAIHKVMTDGK